MNNKELFDKALVEVSDRYTFSTNRETAKMIMERAKKMEKRKETKHKILIAVAGIAGTAAVLTGAVFGLNWLNEHGGLHEGGIKTDNGAGSYDPVAVIDASQLSENTPDKITVSAEDTANTENNDTAIIDADVVLPDNTKYAVYNVSNRTRSEEEAKAIKDLLLNDPDADFELLKYDDGITIYHWENSDRTLIVRGDSMDLVMMTSFSDYVLDRFSPPSPNGALKPGFDERELYFCTIQSAANTVTEILNDIGISVANSPEVFSISLSENTGETPVECYYLRFNMQFDDIPIYNELISYKTIPNYATFNPVVDAIYSSDGLMYLNVTDYFGNAEKAYDVTELITAEAAAQIALEKYSEVVTTSSIVFDKIELMYVYIPDKKDKVVRMTPAWICTGTNTEIVDLSERGGTGTTEQIRKITVIINALDGKEII